MFGDKEFGKNEGYPTPESTPDETTCLLLNVPASAAWWAIYTGLLYTLTSEDAWQQFEGGMEREDAAAAAQVIFDDAMDRAAATDTCETDVGTPFWDDASDVDDEASADTQTWYGEVTNPTDPPAELTFVENAAVWTFTGLLALATPEVGFAPAVLFHTIAPKFIVAQKRGDFATIIQIFLDGEQQAKIDTTDNAPDDIIEIPVIGDDGEHDLLIMNTLP